MIKILLSTCMWTSIQTIGLIRNNPDGELVEVHGGNLNLDHMPLSILDGHLTLPRYGLEYIETLVQYCKDNHIDVVIPTIDAELAVLSDNIDKFEQIGTKVSVSAIESLKTVADKSKLANKYGQYMPTQKICKNLNDLYAFEEEIGDAPYCMKLKNSLGGHGFVAVDNKKADDISNYGVYCGKQYTNIQTAHNIVMNCCKNGSELILQQYIDGIDYSVNLLADHGKVIDIAGYKVPLLQEGFAISAQVHRNDEAFAVAETIVRETCYDGNACFDFIMKQDGSVKLLEVNARINTNHALIAYAGKNMLWKRICQLLGHPIASQNFNERMCMRRTYQCVFYEDETN